MILLSQAAVRLSVLRSGLQVPCQRLLVRLQARPALADVLLGQTGSSRWFPGAAWFLQLCW